MQAQLVEITGNSPDGDYKQGESGHLVAFCRGGDDRPYGVVLKESGAYVMVSLHSIVAIRPR